MAQQEMKVDKIMFYGNNHIKSGELRKLISTRKGKPYKEFQATIDKSRIIAFYKARGYKDVRITDWNNEIDKERINCRIYIEEGIRIYIREIKFEGNKLFPSSQLAKIANLKPNAPYDEGAVFTAKYNIANFYAEKGYPYAEVTDSISYASLYEFSVILSISEYKLARFGDVELQGREGIRGAIATREIVFKKGDIYSPEKLYESQAKIYGTDLFKSVKFEIPDFDKKKDTLNIVFVLQKQKPRSATLGLGYIYPNRAWFNAGWGNSNLWGNAQKLGIQFDYEAALFSFQAPVVKATASYIEPYLLNTKFKGEAEPFYNFRKVENPDSTYQLTSYGVQGKVGRYIGRFFQSFIGYNYKVVSAKGNVPNDSGFANSLLFSANWDSRTDIFYPRKGALASFSLESGGKLLGGDFNFNKLIFDFATYSPDLKTTIASRIRFGTIFGNAPLESKFFLGSENTIRGFPDMTYNPEWEDEIGILNVEFRELVSKSFELAYFVDAGNVWQKIEDIKIRDCKLGAGIGIRYRTPIGPLRLDYGYGLFPKTSSKGNLYFTIGYMF